MDGSLQPRRDTSSIIPATESHSTDGNTYTNAQNNINAPYNTPYRYPNTQSMLGLDQLIAAFGGTQQGMNMQNPSPTYTNSPSIFSPATPIYNGQSPSLSPPHKSPYSPHSPSFAEHPPLFSSMGAGRHDSGWNPQSSPHGHGTDLQYPISSTSGLHPEQTNTDSSHIILDSVNTFGSNSIVPGSRAWLSSRIKNLTPNQCAEVESKYTIWERDPERQTLVVNILCDWFELEKSPAKEDLLKFYRAKLGPIEDSSRARGGKGGQGARGGAIGYDCDWPGCDKPLSGRTDRVHEDALNHLNIKIFSCDAKDCNAAFLRKNELNRHVKSCKYMHPNTNALFLSMPPSPLASTSRQSSSRPASNRPGRRTPRSTRGVSAEVSPSTSGRDSPLMTRAADSFQPFLPQSLSQGHFQPQPQHPQQVSGFGTMGDSQMMFHSHPQQQQQQHNHPHPHHGRNNSSSQPMAGMNASDMNPMSFSDQFPIPSSSHGLGPRGSPPRMQALFNNMQQSRLQHSSHLQEAPMVPSHMSSTAPHRDGLPLPPRRISVAAQQGFASFNHEFYPTGSYPDNGNMSGYAYFSADQQQPHRPN